MARKKIQKAPKSGKKKEEQSHHSEEEPVPEEPKKVEAPSEPASLFSSSFNSRIDKFKTFYTDFLTLRGSDDEE